ncbi:integral membrane protein-like protein [Ectocarpus siliculosus]|uniref:Integral membrane protein-like protein n=1 Tax=Ectocarpus siliculosus TaxID=2880 RepID=D7G038_ECTSI|nr:integral membrane protein-like protein [Ectocarpus siliculosus]|eukprot:CBJ32920.1 integral membrane protein-like protein [Ectocarpus siliculosus]
METFGTERKFAWDHARTMRMGITGAFFVTPASFAWNMYAERLAPGRSLRAVVTKLGVSVAVLPPMLAAQFASLTLLEEGKTMGDVRTKLSRDFTPTLKNAILFWPVVSVINSAFVPVLSRPVFSSFVGVFWNVYISYQANHNGMEVGELSVVYPTEQKEEEEAASRQDAATLGRAVVVGSAAVALAEKAAEKQAVAAATAAVLAGEKAAGVSVGGSAIAAATGAGETAGGEEGVPAEPARKKRGRFVRRTSVVSM